jgi:hypothetical protein
VPAAPVAFEARVMHGADAIVHQQLDRLSDRFVG